mgnify:CR=1 FL=1
MYNEGSSIAGDLLDLGVEWNAIKKAGNSYSYKDNKLGVGRENAKAALKLEPQIMSNVREEIVNAWRVKEGLTEEPIDEQEAADDADDKK